jgi:uncharacterized protein YpmS
MILLISLAIIVLLLLVFAIIKVANGSISNKSLKEASMEMAIEISSTKNLEEMAEIIESGVIKWIRNDH